MKNFFAIKLQSLYIEARRKDQCDRDSAVAKKIINAFVHAGNDCLSAEHIKKGILFKGGPKNNSKVCAVNVDKTKSYMSQSKITNISYFHSIVYC